MDRYDFIFAGAGCAALSLVFHLKRSSLSEKKVLLIDPLIDQVPDKTWCYWADKALEIHPKHAIHSWDNVQLNFQGKSSTNNLGDLRYFHINSKDFYQAIFEDFKKNKNIVFKKASVKSIQENAFGVNVMTEDGDEFQTDTVFDSRFDPNQFIKTSHLKQVFSGWRIETTQPVFNKSAFTLMETRKNSNSHFDFFYILPFSENSALVEFTAYSKDNINQTSLENELKNYLTQQLKITDYKISFQESGTIPMTTRKLNRKESKKIIPIGTAAGWTKASTGYTFQRIQENAKIIISNLEKNAPVEKGIHRKLRFEFYDNILLNIASKWPERLPLVFEDLFRKNPTKMVFRFLSEETSFFEEFKLLSRLSYPIFIKSLLSYEKN